MPIGYKELVADAESRIKAISAENALAEASSPDVVSCRPA